MYQRILVTGGSGFVGSNIAIYLKGQFPDLNIISFDNLKRRGSELSLTRLKEQEITFVHGDIRNEEDLQDLPPFDLMIECSAEPSVMAGTSSSPRYLLNTNLVGTINCLEAVRKNQADILFLSTSRVYPIHVINNLEYTETDSRFIPIFNPSICGITDQGISESLSLSGSRSLYGTTKFCSEHLIEEYVASYGIKAIINRCGLISGPWQMGKVDQGVVMHWVISHIQGSVLSYIGYGGEGKQVRDVLHISDLCRLIKMQVMDPDLFANKPNNVGGGSKYSVSLLELSKICQDVTGRKVQIQTIPDTRPNDLIWYVTDNRRITDLCGWRPEISVPQTIKDIASWITDNSSHLISALD